MKYKAIISDVDGTLTTKLTNFDNLPLPSKKVLDAVKKASKKVNFVLATARSASSTEYLLDLLNLSSPCIVHNGALIIEGQTKKVIYEKKLSDKDLKLVVKYFLKNKIEFSINEKNKMGVKYTDNYIPKDPLVVFVSELNDQEVKKIEHDLSNISTIALHKVHSWTPTLWGINITDANVSKQHAVLEIARILNIYPEEIIGIGDGPNDFPLLMACGLKVAMGNAIEDLKAIADYVAPSVDEDGVAWVIEKFILV